ncbi:MULTISPECIES: mechanosensitive ion channel domain-containing protein [unclassified Colwellia]|jgi:small conductance mechanosensitive channel|uniref:mechanosensitive ion channel family protein n=1 Tax=unclassified Colwellia TaxID=196834 RepID=UPI000D39716B|nr:MULTISPECIES: mechanosensitive ion channel domain-containing protein [unclassified Colwellia]AWB56686.1 mechanosensitive ion channel protein [Colwellia sp. Arc7-D]MBA6414916.1 mechanosensitive ion channel [Colwellia sp. 6M3]|tara:strand:- start:6222 stop:7052 length:831 start_codon:yes stop_codon:yes gene_type:complete
MDTIQNWFLENQQMLMDFAIKLVVALAIVFIGKFVANLVRDGVVKVMRHRGMDETIISFLSSLLYGMLFVIVIIAAISHLGFNTTSLVAIVGAAGLAIGLALQGSLSNFASGVLLIILKPFKSGDFIDVAGVSGIVEEIHVFSTKLRTGDNKAVIIPNGKITSSTITNFSTKPERRLDLVIGVSYDADLAKTKALLTKITSEHELVLKDKEVVIGVQELAESSVNFVVRPWVTSADYWPLHRDLLQKIKVALDDAGIEIPYPQLSLHVRKEETNES